MACILLWSSAVRVHDSKAYRKMDVTRERISRIFELREILLSIQAGFSLVNAAVVCAILESISWLEPSSDKTEPSCLKLEDCLKLLSFYFELLAIPLVLFVMSLSYRLWSPCRRLWRLCRDAQLILPVLLPLLLSHLMIYVICKAKISDCSTSNADSAFVIF